MAVQTITAGTWQSVVTLTGNTVFINKSSRPMWLLTGSTAGVAVEDGYPMPPNKEALLTTVGLVVSAGCLGGSGVIEWMLV